MAMVNVLYRLLDADSDQQADRNGGDVDEEVSPRMRRVVGRVNVEHSVSGRDLGSWSKWWLSSRAVQCRLVMPIF
jgi:hypothetical protein